MPNQFLSPEGDLENYFVTEYQLIDQYIGDELWVWGKGTSGQLGDNTVTTKSTPVTTFAGGTNWKQVSAGRAHTAAIKTDGTLWTWGYGTQGALGDNTTTDKSTPVTTFAGGTNWKQVSAGGRAYTAAIKTDGTLWTWGYGAQGQLGDNTAFSKFTPATTFAGGTNWKQVSAGNRHCAAIKTDGTLWTWGDGDQGRLGTNDATNKSTPVTTFAGGTNWKQVSSSYHCAAIKTDGTLWTWGLGTLGQLGRLNSNSNKSTPVTTFTGGTNWADTATAEPEDLYTISAGNSFNAAIKTDGTLWTWGLGTYGRLGDNTTVTKVTPVTTFAGGTIWKQVSAGYRFCAAIKTDGTLWTWGGGTYGRLGTNDTTDKNTPVTTFAGGTDWKQVSAGGFHCAAIKTDGTLWTWGRGSSGRLGDNTVTNKSTPVTTFAGGTNWKQVSAGSSPFSAFSAAIKTDGTLWTWGYNASGQLGDNTVTTKSTPVTTFAGGTNWKQVSAGGINSQSHCAAIKTDGTLWTWGYGAQGQLGNNTVTPKSTPVTTFAGGTNWKQVSAGYRYCAAIKTDGTLWTWGLGTSGQLGDNTATNKSTPVTTFAGGTNWKQVGAGNNHTVALLDDGVNKQLFLFGNNNNGQLGSPPPSFTPDQVEGNSTNWKQVSAGALHCAAIKTDGTLWIWGYGNNGRLGINGTTNKSTPVTTFAGGTNWKQVSSGNNQCAAIKTDGTLWTWGYSVYTQQATLGNNASGSRSTPVTTFAGGTNWKQVSNGGNFSAAVTAGISPEYPLS